MRRKRRTPARESPASQEVLRKKVGGALAQAGMKGARTDVSGYEIGRAGAGGKAQFVVVRHSANDDAMVRQDGRLLRHSGLAVTYFVHQGRPMLRVD